MVDSQVIEGTSEEIAALLQDSVFAGRRVRVIIEPEEQDFSDSLSAPPNTVRDAAHLAQLLREGFASPTHEATEESWEEKRREVRRRMETRPR